MFAAHRIDEQLAKALDRKVWLPSGGSLVIDRTEAMIVVDVNTGKFTGQGGNLEETVTRNNLEAAEEIVRQLRLRDLGGIIVIDFIDMVLESNRDLVLRRLARVPRPRPHQAPGRRGHLARAGPDDPQAGRAGPARGVQRALRALQRPRRDHDPRRAGRRRRAAAAATAGRVASAGGEAAQGRPAPGAAGESAGDRAAEARRRRRVARPAEASRSAVEDAGRGADASVARRRGGRPSTARGERPAPTPEDEPARRPRPAASRAAATPAVSAPRRPSASRVPAATRAGLTVTAAAFVPWTV